MGTRGYAIGRGYKKSITQNDANGYNKMYDWINEILLTFRQCFTRKNKFKWFVVIILGLMIRQDHLGVTSIIRELGLKPQWYETMLHFFRSSAWNLEGVTAWWIQVVGSCGFLILENGMPILIGDGVKQGKGWSFASRTARPCDLEGRRMPCVKRLHQESETVSKAPYIFGHMFGAIGVLVGNASKLFCAPLSIRIHDGDAQIKKWSGDGKGDESHVIRIIREACAAVKILGRNSILLLDRYYLSVPALMALQEEQARAGKPLLSVVMRAKRNPTAYEDPIPNKRGRPRKKGETVKIKDLFEFHAHEFIEAVVTMYGKTESILYYTCDLLWGKKLYQKLRFVLVVQGDARSIFVCTDLTMTPVQILRLYGYRFKIECCFRELKQVIAGFAYRFWSFSMPRLNRFAKSGYDPLESVNSDKDRIRITRAFNAIQGFVMAASIAFGLLQICALRFADEINAPHLRWLRSRTNVTPSEATTSHFMGKTIFRFIAFRPDLPIMRFILERQSSVPPDSLIHDNQFGA